MMNAHIADRMNKGHYFDSRILDLDNVEVMKADIVDGSDPVIVLSFRCQHVHCVRDNVSDIVEGSEVGFSGVIR